SPRSRGFFRDQASKASLAASTAAFASSTLALATDAIVRSVAGSITSKRSLSEDLRHFPLIQRSVGTSARRFSYIELSSSLYSGRERSSRAPKSRKLQLAWIPGISHRHRFTRNRVFRYP